MKLKLEKIGLLFDPLNTTKDWVTHAMAPTSFVQNDIIRVFIGGWDEDGISRIYEINLKKLKPKEIINVIKKPILDIGVPGCFDENGVFPGHVSIDEDQVYLSYTGFQLGHKIPHYNFSGLLKLINNVFVKTSNSPLLDRHDEGLFVRAGHSFIKEGKFYHSVYSSGSTFETVGGKFRPNYNVFYKKTLSLDKSDFASAGKKIIEFEEGEHGLGRPQIFILNKMYFVIYTVRTVDMKYSIGISYSKDLIDWNRYYWDIEQFKSLNEFDSKMIYFPFFQQIGLNWGYIFYSGNEFGKFGLGAIKLEINND